VRKADASALTLRRDRGRRPKKADQQAQTGRKPALSHEGAIHYKPLRSARFHFVGTLAEPADRPRPRERDASLNTEKSMTARIYKPAKTAMQSGKAKTKDWVLDFEPSEPKEVEPLMGWTTSGDTRQQVRLRFDTKEEAVAYCERNGIPYQVFDPKPTKRPFISYSDNFAFNRRTPWTH
jgi:ETC complex I subunit conserved region